MKKLTIKESIYKVLKKENKALLPREIYELIVDGKLYEFKSKTPSAVVNSELRKSSEGIHLKKSSSVKIFKIDQQGKYTLK